MGSKFFSFPLLYFTFAEADGSSEAEAFCDSLALKIGTISGKFLSWIMA